MESIAPGTGTAPWEHQRPTAHPDGRSHLLWRDSPALSWMLNLGSGRIELRLTHPAPGDAGEPVGVRHEDLAMVLMRHLRGGNEPFRTLETLVASDGTAHQFLLVGFPIWHAGEPRSAGVALDVTGQQSRIEELAHQALVDDLTGVYNRRGFLLFGEHELRVARRRGTPSAILYVDVDGLKAVNSAGGHDAGNALLVQAGAMLRSVFRECDVIGRIGGDEFAVFAADVQGDPERLRLRLERAVAATGNGHPPKLSLSAGVGWTPADPGLQLAALVSAADQAMYRDKARRASS